MVPKNDTSKKDETMKERTRRGRINLNKEYVIALRHTTYLGCLTAQAECVAQCLKIP